MDKTAYEAIKIVDKPVRKKEPRPWGNRLTYMICEGAKIRRIS